jgi:hypothetical protein
LMTFWYCFFELPDRHEAALEDAVVDAVQVSWSHLKLTGAGGKEVGSGEWMAEIGDEKSGKREVEWKDGLDAVGHVGRRVAGGLASGRAIGTKDEVCKSGPF